MENPYFDAWQALPGTINKWGLLHPENSMIDHLRARRIFAPRYAWALPSEEAIKMLVSYGPLVEMGAGTGYWAWCVRQLGGDIIAYDVKPYNNHWCGRIGQRDRDALNLDAQLRPINTPKISEKTETRWIDDVLPGRPKHLAQHRDRTLFLCWPPYRSNMASNCLRWHKSQRIIYVGEGNGGATATNAFHDHLTKNFEEIQSLAIPQWVGLHDRLWVYERKR